MSATLGDVTMFTDDLTRRTGRSTAVIGGTERPVPLEFSYAVTPLHETIEELLEKDRAPVYVVHFTQKDAADMLGISLSGMKSRVQRGRDKVRDMFDACCRISVDCRGRVVECEPRGIMEVPEDCRDTAVSWAARRGL